MLKFKGGSCNMTDQQQKIGMVESKPTALYFGSQIYPFNVGYLRLYN